MPSSDPGNELAKRLAKKSGLAEKQAKAFLEALLSLIAEEQKTTSSLGLLLSAIAPPFASSNTITIPMHFGKTFGGKPIVAGIRPPLFAPIKVGHGGYPGPLLKEPFAKIVIDPGQVRFDLNKLDLTDVHGALTKALSVSKIKGAKE